MIICIRPEQEKWLKAYLVGYGMIVTWKIAACLLCVVYLIQVWPQVEEGSIGGFGSHVLHFCASEGTHISLNT
jgi:hypothetical protein